MGFFIKVRAVLNRYAVLVQSFGAIAFILLFTTIFHQQGTAADLFWATCAATIFLWMVIEDYRFMTVDLRAFLLLAVLFCWISSRPTWLFLGMFFLGCLFFRIVYIFFAIPFLEPFHEQGDAAVSTPVEPEAPAAPLGGYLPILALSLGLVYGFQILMENSVIWGPAAQFWEGVQDGIALLAEELTPHILAILGLFVGGWLPLEYQLWKQSKVKVIEAPYGEGDILLLGLFFAFLGMVDLLGILVFSGVAAILLRLFMMYCFRMKTEAKEME